jgi:hypothetical protein
VDVADEAGLAAYISAYGREGWPPIRGVVHAAGVVDDSLLQDLDPNSLERVWRPKVHGAWLLDRLLADMPLDFFIMYSSVAALAGQPGQASYASANAFLDALAEDRQRRGFPALSVQWGPWKDVGMTATREGRVAVDRLERAGVAAIGLEEGVATFHELLSVQGRRTVLAIDWERYAGAARAGIGMGIEIDASMRRSTGSPSDGPSQPEVGAGLRERLAAADEEEAQAILETYLRDLMARSIGIEPTSLAVDAPLDKVGLDSLIALEIRNQIAADLEVAVPIVTFLQGPSVSSCAREIAVLRRARVPSPGYAAPPPVLPARRASEEQVEHLSDRQVDSLLEDLLSDRRRTE